MGASPADSAKKYYFFLLFIFFPSTLITKSKNRSVLSRNWSSFAARAAFCALAFGRAPVSADRRFFFGGCCTLSSLEVLSELLSEVDVAEALLEPDLEVEPDELDSVEPDELDSADELESASLAPSPEALAPAPAPPRSLLTESLSSLKTPFLQPHSAQHWHP
jgi:hypothetical protein